MAFHLQRLANRMDMNRCSWKLGVVAGHEPTVVASFFERYRKVAQCPDVLFAIDVGGLKDE